MWISFLLAYPAMRVIVIAARQPGEWAPRAFLGTLVVLAAAIVALASLAVRMHPERWIARRFLLVGIGLAIVVAFTQAMVLVLGRPAGLVVRLLGPGARPIGIEPEDDLIDLRSRLFDRLFTHDHEAALLQDPDGGHVVFRDVRVEWARVHVGKEQGERAAGDAFPQWSRPIQ